MVEYGLLHCHSDNSINDSVMTVQSLVQRAKQIGAPAVALTDAGNMIGYLDFIQTCENGGIKPITGIEAFMEEKDEGVKLIVLLAKDYQGFQALIKAVNESNSRPGRIKSSFSKMNKGILEKYFGPGSAGHGHVIATSAGITGVFAKVIPGDKICREERKKYLKHEALWYKRVFGSEDFYIELQYHGIEKERTIMAELSELSDEVNIPVCISNSIFTPTNCEADVLARKIVQTELTGKWSAQLPEDSERYIKTDSELIAKISEIIPIGKVQEGYMNVGKIVAACNLKIPKTPHYPKFAPPLGFTPESFLRKIAYEGIKKRYPQSRLTLTNLARLEHELKVIISMGYADYICIVIDILHYARAAGLLYLDVQAEASLALTFDTSKIENYVKGRAGEAVSPGRGSASGSLVCYLTEITNVDPIKYGLSFERFLNPDRVTMPDIDCDIERTVRPYVIKYIKHKYGEESVCGILTRGTRMGKSALNVAVSVLGIKAKNDSRAYTNLGNLITKRASEIHQSGDIRLSEVNQKLLRAFADNPDAEEIIRYALLVEGSCSHISQHQAGIIITDGYPVDTYVPLINNSTNQIKMTQCDMKQAESIGLLKIDFLSLNFLTIITETVRDIQKEKGLFIDIDTIPYEKEVFEHIYSKGMTNAVFQCMSEGMQKALNSLQPENLSDLILIIAMFRPGPIQFLEDVIAFKNGRKPISYFIGNFDFGEDKKERMFRERAFNNCAFEHDSMTTRSEDIKTFNTSLVSKQIVFI